MFSSFTNVAAMYVLERVSIRNATTWKNGMEADNRRNDPVLSFETDYSSFVLMSFHFNIV